MSRASLNRHLDVLLDQVPEKVEALQGRPPVWCVQSCLWPQATTSQATSAYTAWRKLA
ncbi:hypothetical protein [Janthinobacterium sp. RB2R34]|uniref:hypothetical protein n=1 Tax=Janthinobacterium sp. RB2R34 TaxID=3424193 RepID=UPI003F213728